MKKEERVAVLEATDPLRSRTDSPLLLPATNRTRDTRPMRSCRIAIYTDTSGRRLSRGQTTSRHGRSLTHHSHHSRTRLDAGPSQCESPSPPSCPPSTASGVFAHHRPLPAPVGRPRLPTEAASRKNAPNGSGRRESDRCHWCFFTALILSRNRSLTV